jgi:hypothetical protein
MKGVTMKSQLMKRLLVLATVTNIAGLPLFLTGCDQTESRSKTTTTTTKESPEGTKKTTETTEKKVETNPK